MQEILNNMNELIYIKDENTLVLSGNKDKVITVIIEKDNDRKTENAAAFWGGQSFWLVKIFRRKGGGCEHLST